MEIKNNPRIKIPIFANGDIDSPEKVKFVRDKFGVDGVMIGRAAIGYPWIFNEIKYFLETGNHLPKPTIEDRVNVCKKHFLKSIEWKGEKLGILEMRRHYSNYFRGLENIKEFRSRLVTLFSVEEILSVLEEIVEKYSHMEFAL